jgi:hypothetical protein
MPLTLRDVLSKDRRSSARLSKSAPVPNPKWIDMDSDNLKAIFYSPEGRFLTVQFHSDESIGYRYSDISQRLVDGLQEADSPTAYLRRYVIGRHKVVRIKL